MPWTLQRSKALILSYMTGSSNTATAGPGSVALNIFSPSLLPFMSSSLIHMIQWGFWASMGWLSICTVTLSPMPIFSNVTWGTWVAATASFQGPKFLAVYGSGWV